MFIYVETWTLFLNIVSSTWSRTTMKNPVRWVQSVRMIDLCDHGFQVVRGKWTVRGHGIGAVRRHWMLHGGHEDLVYANLLPIHCTLVYKYNDPYKKL